VEQVSWNTIQGFLAHTGMRLPTEAEWEYAYRAGTTTAFHGFTGFDGLYLNGTNDGNLVVNIAWYSANSNSQTFPVGEMLANGFGLHDMAGNVFEWVSDWYGSTYYSSSPQTNPTGPASGSYRLVRGGSWFDSPGYLRASSRYRYSPDYANDGIGFRVARNP
jgi:formylglycine-generating enzyme required for sulfatase activity